MPRSLSLLVFPLLLASCVSLAADSSRGENHAALLHQAVQSVSAAELQSHVDVLADDQFEGREAGTRGGAAAGVYIMKALVELDLKPAGLDGGYFQDFAGGRNILAVLPGSDPELKNEYIVVGGHYDHVGYGNRSNSYGPFGYVHNGADDNASGVAGVLETAEALVESGLTPKRSILFAFWDGEEKGLLGSHHFVNHPTISLDAIAMAFNVDMIGQLRNQTLEVYGVRSAPGLRRLVSLNNLDPNLKLKYSWELKANSDHHSFLSQHIPTLMFHTGLHDRYHRPADDAHTVNRDGMEQVARLLVRSVAAAADLDERLPYRVQARFETEPQRELLEQPSAAPPARLGLAWKREEDQLTITHVAGVAANADMRVGDRILRFQGAEPPSDEQMRLVILGAAEPINWELQRGEETLKISTTPVGPPSRIGVSWRADEADSSCVVITLIRTGSAAENAGLNVGDRILHVNGQTFNGSDDLVQQLSTLPAPIEVLLERDGQVRQATLRPLDR